MVRKLILTALAGLMILGAAIQSPAATTVAPYAATGRFTVSPGPANTFAASAALTLLGPRLDTPAAPPARGTLSLTGAVRSRLVPPSPCLGSILGGALSISWNNGTKSKGTFTAVISRGLIVSHGRITSGRFAGGTLELVGINAFPPSPCAAPFSGIALLPDAA